MIEFDLPKTERHNRPGTIFFEGRHVAPGDFGIDPLDIGRHYSLNHAKRTGAKRTGAVLLLFLGGIAIACVPGKTIDYAGTVVGETYLSAQQTQSSSLYILVVETNDGVKKFQVEDGYANKGFFGLGLGDRVTKESLDATVSIGDEVRIILVKEESSKLPAITASVLNVQELPKK